MKDLESWLKERRITEVECLVSDITGIARGKITPVSKFVAEKGMRLPESVLLQTVTGDYVEDDLYYSLLDPADIDMLCRPDGSAVYPVPWAAEPTAQVIHDCYDKMGNPIELSCRNQLKRVLALYAEQGWKPVVAPEMEFYLTKRCEDPDLPLQPPIGRSGRQETGRQSFSIDAANEFDPLFEDMYDWCEIQGLDIDTLIHEEGTAQMEINFRHGDPSPWRTRCSCSSVPCARRRSSMTWPPPSWPSRLPTSPAAPCIFIKACWMPPRAGACLPMTTAP